MTAIRALIDRILREPILLRNAAIGLVSIVALFGLTIEESSVDKVLSVVFLVLPLLASWLAARPATTPVADPVLPTGTHVSVEGTDDIVVVQPTPPGPVGYEEPFPDDGFEGRP